MERTRIQLADGVYLTYLPARKFKTSLLSAQFVTPLQQETASAYALLPAILRRGTVRYPDLGALSARLDRLYGASVDYTVRKQGENQCVGFVASFIDDSYIPGGEQLLEPVAELLGELLCDPVTERGRFVTAYFEGEKTNLIDAIRSQVNDKREYAYARLLREMCDGEPYGISRLGDEAGAEKLQMPKLHALYGELLATARLELFYCGSASLERVREALAAAFATLPRDGIRDIAPSTPHPARTEVKRVEEAMDVTQGKLGMGFACGSDDYAAALMGNTLFGGSSNSKLFLNVREKLSLCYYASSAYHRQKRLITVSSGIEFQNYQKAYDEIMAQLAAVQAGRLEDWELEGARSTLLNAYASTPHPARTEVKRVEEAMDVTQGKLGMGFACGSDDYAAALMGNTLFGGSSNSKLFLNVREKLSLCYYASSAYHRQKRLITVSSGIEFQNYQKAYDEIMAQLAAVQAGRLEDWELEGARSTLLNAYASMGDSQGKLENFYLGQAATGQEDTPELLAEQVRHVTAERIFDAMQTASLDTVYFLKGKETAE